MTTDQIGVVCPLEVLLHCAIIQSNPSVIMTQTCERKAYFLNILNDLFMSLCRKSMFLYKNTNLQPSVDQVKTKTRVPLINSCSAAAVMLLRWALCSLQSFSASSQVCLCVKYLWRRNHGSRYEKPYFICSRADVNVTNAGCIENNPRLEQTLMQIKEANMAEGLLTDFGRNSVVFHFSYL